MIRPWTGCVIQVTKDMEKWEVQENVSISPYLSRWIGLSSEDGVCSPHGESIYRGPESEFKALTEEVAWRNKNTSAHYGEEYRVIKWEDFIKNA